MGCCLLLILEGDGIATLACWIGYICRRSFCGAVYLGCFGLFVLFCCLSVEGFVPVRACLLVLMGVSIVRGEAFVCLVGLLLVW